MKTQTAKLNYLRMAPRKVRLVATMIKGLTVNEAEAHLILNPKRASEPVLQLLRSAVSNAKNKQLNTDKLIIKEIRVDKGPMLKRWLPRAQGRATPIQKKSSHLIIILEESTKAKETKYKITKPERVKKSKAEKMKAEQQDHKEYEKGIKEKKESASFGKRMFRRKLI